MNSRVGLGARGFPPREVAVSERPVDSEGQAAMCWDRLVGVEGSSGEST